MNNSEKCKLWVRASIDEHISDNTYDLISYQLAKNYEKLPKWFTNVVPKQNLVMGSVFDIEPQIQKLYRDIFK